MDTLIDNVTYLRKVSVTERQKEVNILQNKNINQYLQHKSRRAVSPVQMQYREEGSSELKEPERVRTNRF